VREQLDELDRGRRKAHDEDDGREQCDHQPAGIEANVFVDRARMS
jgi:hypothetical protein